MTRARYLDEKNTTQQVSGVVVRNAPMHDQILPYLRRDIIENRWKSGERLPEPQLCKEFGISRTPLRQALKTLEAEGLVRLVPHVGAIVTDPDVSEIGETMEILIALEQLAATRVAEAGQPDVIDKIQGIYRDMQAAAKHNDASRYYSLNDDFHHCIVHGAGNAALAELHEKVMLHVHRERHRANAVEPFTVQSSESHDDVVNAIVNRDPEKAGIAMRKHLEHISKIMLARRRAINGEAGDSSAPAA